MDPFVIAVGLGLVASIVTGPVLTAAINLLPERWRRTTTWLLIAGAAIAAIGGDLLSSGPGPQGTFAFVIAALPGIVAYLAWRTILASVVVAFVPLYFPIASLIRDRPMHAPAIALDSVVPLQPAWMLIYGSMYVFVLLPLLVVRDQPLFRRALKAYLMVLSGAYVVFLAYPTISPRPEEVAGQGFAVWCLRLNYSLDTPYNCFPSLHVAHSFVSALASFRVNRRVGLIAVGWAALVGVSTVFTKQHYALDVIAGALLGWVAYVVFLQSYPREAISARDSSRAPRRALGVVAIFGGLVAAVWILYLTGAVT